MKNYNLRMEKHKMYINFHNIRKHKMCKLFMNYIDSKEQHMPSKYLHSNNIKDYNLYIKMPSYMLCMVKHMLYKIRYYNSIHIHNYYKLFRNYNDSMEKHMQYISFHRIQKHMLYMLLSHYMNNKAVSMLHMFHHYYYWKNIHMHNLHIILRYSCNHNKKYRLIIYI